MTDRNELRAEIEIDAEPARVWMVLMDFEAYPDWNPFITSIQGERTVGARLRARLQPACGRGITMSPSVTVNVPGTAFGPSGAGHVRVCYATAYEEIVEAMDRIERFVGRHRG